MIIKYFTCRFSLHSTRGLQNSQNTEEQSFQPFQSKLCPVCNFQICCELSFQLIFRDKSKKFSRTSYHFAIGKHTFRIKSGTGDIYVMVSTCLKHCPQVMFPFPSSEKQRKSLLLYFSPALHINHKRAPCTLSKLKSFHLFAIIFLLYENVLLFTPHM